MNCKYIIYMGIFLQGAVQAENKPNFVILLTDDQTYESLQYLNQTIHIPNMNSLMKEGTVFTNTFNQGSWSAAVSVASRCMLMTGQNVFEARRNDTYLEKWARVNHEQSITNVCLWGETFKKNGYRTFITGKWDASKEALLKSFSEGRAINDGSYSFSSKEAQQRFYKRDSVVGCNTLPFDTTVGGHWSPVVKDIINLDGRIDVSSEYKVLCHSSELYKKEAISFLENYDNKSPFFMYIAFNAPHDPRQSPEEYVNYYLNRSIEIPINFQKLHPFDQGDSQIRDEQLVSFPRTEDAVRLHRSEYYAIISHLDKCIGEILDTLKTLNLDKNTYIILTSDNGLAVGSHGLMGKQNQYEHSIRVPLVIKGPLVKKNVKNDALVYMQSIFPTTCDLAGIQVPETVTYRSLCPIMKGQSRGEDYILGVYKGLQRMIRDNHYKMIVYPKIRKIQFFDIKKDPFEKVDLFGERKYQSIINKQFSELKIRLKELKDNIEIGEISDYFL